MNDTENTENLIDKILLIGITVLDEKDEIISQVQVYGPIIRVTDDLIVIRRNETQAEFTIPAYLDNVKEAKPHEYKLRTTGEIVTNPDYLSSWTVHFDSEEQVEEYAKVGFGGYQPQ